MSAQGVRPERPWPLSASKNAATIGPGARSSSATAVASAAVSR